MEYAKLDGEKVIKCSYKEYIADGAEVEKLKQEFVGDYWVSTVFLGFNHGGGVLGPDAWFETMVFKKDATKKTGINFAEIYCDRYATYDDAMNGHDKTVELVKQKDFDRD